MDLTVKPEHEEFRLRLRRWLHENLPAGWGADSLAQFRSYEEEVAFMRDWQGQLYRGGWAGLLWPKEYGGAGATTIEQAILNEEMARAQAPELINKVGVHNVGPTLINYGTEAQKRRFLSKILSAEEIWCQLFSEPGAGSDLAGLRTRAESDGDGYRLTGQKVWTSYAEFSRWAICLARTDASVPKHKGITYFIVDMQAPGIQVRPLRQITGGTEFNEVFLDAVYVPRDFVIGKENEGWGIAMNTLAHERGTGYLFKEQVKHKIAVDRLVEMIRQAKRHGRSVHPALRAEVINAFIRVEIMRLLNYDTMSRMSRGQEPGPDSSLKKEFWNRLSQHLHETALALEGPWSQLMPDDPRAIDSGRWQQTFLYSRSVTISGGSSEIQLNIIAQRLLGLPKE
ncbi:MAG: acyl-CoA dehydrogenase family protein [Deltaproteobacteria bacterium]|nr:acyl-CoA dehydrogenase family protein [Deltaproteobacteria bacterium]